MHLSQYKKNVQVNVYSTNVSENYYRCNLPHNFQPNNLFLNLVYSLILSNYGICFVFFLLNYQCPIGYHCCLSLSWRHKDKTFLKTSFQTKMQRYTIWAYIPIVKHLDINSLDGLRPTVQKMSDKAHLRIKNL